MFQRLIHARSSKKVTILLVLVLIFGLAQPAAAQAIIYGDTVPADTQVDQNLILTGYNVTIDGTVNGDVMAFGTRITVNGTVNGSLVAAAEYVNINGQVTGNVYSAALLLNLAPSANINRDLLFLGVQLNLQPTSTIDRDLLTLSLLSASFAGEVGRQTYAEIGPSAIIQFIFDLAGWPLPNWLGSGSLPPSWTAQRFAVAHPNIVTTHPLTLSGAGMQLLPIAGRTLLGGEQGSYFAPSPQIDPMRLRDWGMGLLRNLAALLVVGLLMSWLVPGTLSKASERLRHDFWPSVGWGLVVYLVGWFLFALLFTLILALTIFLLMVSFVNIGFLVGGVGLTGLGLAFVLFVVSVVYISKIVAAFLFGRLLLRLVSKSAADGWVAPLLLGIVLYALVASIPYLGFVIATLATFFGLGALWLAVHPVKAASVTIAPVEPAPAILAPENEPVIEDNLMPVVEPIEVVNPVQEQLEAAPEVEKLPVAEELPVEKVVVPEMEEPPLEVPALVKKPARRRKQAAS